MTRKFTLTKYPKFAKKFSESEADNFGETYEEFLAGENFDYYLSAKYDGSYIIALWNNIDGSKAGFFTDKKPEDIEYPPETLKKVEERLKIGFSIFLSLAVSVFGLSGVERISNNPAFIVGIITLIFSLVAIIYAIYAGIHSEFHDGEIDTFHERRVEMIKKFNTAKVLLKISIILIVFSIAMHFVGNTIDLSHWQIETEYKFLKNLFPVLNKPTHSLE